MFDLIKKDPYDAALFGCDTLNAVLTWADHIHPSPYPDALVPSLSRTHEGRLGPRVYFCGIDLLAIGTNLMTIFKICIKSGEEGSSRLTVANGMKLGLGVLGFFVVPYIIVRQLGYWLTSKVDCNALINGIPGVDSVKKSSIKLYNTPSFEDVFQQTVVMIRICTNIILGYVSPERRGRMVAHSLLQIMSLWNTMSHQLLRMEFNSPQTTENFKEFQATKSITTPSSSKVPLRNFQEDLNGKVPVAIKSFKAEIDVIIPKECRENIQQVVANMYEYLKQFNDQTLWQNVSQVTRTSEYTISEWWCAITLSSPFKEIQAVVQPVLYRITADAKIKVDGKSHNAVLSIE